MHLSKRGFTIIASVLLALSGVAVASNQVGSSSASGVTIGDCDSAWLKAPANSTCPTSSVSLPCDMFTVCETCEVEADCLNGGANNATTSSSYTGVPSNVETLVNCNGVLKLPANCQS